jgi:hypothetical protein
VIALQERGNPSAVALLKRQVDGALFAGRSVIVIDLLAAADLDTAARRAYGAIARALPRGFRARGNLSRAPSGLPEWRSFPATRGIGELIDEDDRGGDRSHSGSESVRYSRDACRTHSDGEIAVDESAIELAASALKLSPSLQEFSCVAQVSWRVTRYR